MRPLILVASLLALPLVSFAATASIVTSPGQPTPPLEACFDLSSAFTTGVNQAVKVTVSAYNAEDTAVSFDRVQLMKQGKLVGMNVAAKTEALPRGNPVAFSFDNFGVSPEDLRGVDCVSITFLDHGGKNSTGLVTVKGIDVKVTRDEGDACVIVDPVIIQTPPKPLPFVASVVNEGRVVNANASTSGGGGGSGGTPTSQGPNNPSLAIDDNQVGFVPWTDHSNVYAADGSSASVSTAGSDSYYLKASGFNFSVSGTILGIKVEIKRFDGDTGGVSGYPSSDRTIRLMQNTQQLGNNKAQGGNWPTVSTYAIYGGASDMWGATLAPDAVNAADFGVGVSVTGNPAMVDHIRITVYYTPLGGSIYDAFTDLIHALSNRLFCVITAAPSCSR